MLYQWGQQYLKTLVHVLADLTAYGICDAHGSTFKALHAQRLYLNTIIFNDV
jgi:hypothetical protein